MARHFLGFDRPPADQPTERTSDEIAAEIATLRTKQRRLPAHFEAAREAIAEQIEPLVLEWLAATH